LLSLATIHLYLLPILTIPSHQDRRAFQRNEAYHPKIYKILDDFNLWPNITFPKLPGEEEEEDEDEEDEEESVWPDDGRNDE